MTIDTVNENRAKVGAIFENIEGKKYLIIDLTNTKTSFGEILKIMFASGKGRDKTISADETMTFVVGGTQFIQMFRNKMQAQSNISIAVFDAMDDALKAIEIDRKIYETAS